MKADGTQWTQFVLHLVVWVCTCLTVHSPAEQSTESPDVTTTNMTAAVTIREKTIHNMLNNYDPNIPPDFEEDFPTVVNVQVYIVSFDSISETTMDYSLSIFLRQKWQDRRLTYEPLNNIEALELDARIMSKIWVPDLFFANEKNAAFHDVTVPNRLMHVYPNGTIFFSIRVSMTLSCDMQLQKYPFDSQTCMMILESYGYSTKNVLFKWHDEPVIKRDDLSLPQFELREWLSNDCTKTYVSGNYTCIVVKFNLARSYGYFVAQVYVPSVLIVILSWVSFWLDIDAVPARISLGLLTVLTMTTQSSGARVNLPRVSYVKAIDVWMAMCLFFVFAALLEFAYVNVMSRVERRRREMDRNNTAYKTSGDEEASIAVAVVENHVSGEKGHRPLGSRRPGFSRTAIMRQKARRCDKISRYAFPGVFMGFNIIYWAVYMFWDGS
ncbi:glycine receptor subunit alpha-3-like isoform X2 [Gigantopelta aegis]|uniref:glycine receptor subunit alpha-3-like isoform X2 n=1 Tax=Gigantopelta aegis TaxID=1735272 RepID=UPI001B88C787|nr:glycine receptor subunit alpha-3-like isoform X2 [Gigantopelta aegis]